MPFRRPILQEDTKKLDLKFSCPGWILPITENTSHEASQQRTQIVYADNATLTSWLCDSSDNTLGFVSVSDRCDMNEPDMLGYEDMESDHSL